MDAGELCCHCHRPWGVSRVARRNAGEWRERSWPNDLRARDCSSADTGGRKKWGRVLARGQQQTAERPRVGHWDAHAALSVVTEPRKCPVGWELCLLGFRRRLVPD